MFSWLTLRISPFVCLGFIMIHNLHSTGWLDLQQFADGTCGAWDAFTGALTYLTFTPMSQHKRHRSGWCSELCLSVFLSVFVLRIPNMFGFEIHCDAYFTLEKVRFFSNKKWEKTCLKIPPAVWQMAVLQLVQANVFDSVRPAAKVPPQVHGTFVSRIKFLQQMN